MGVCLIQSCLHNEAFTAIATTQDCAFQNGHMVEEFILSSGEFTTEQEYKIKQTFHCGLDKMVLPCLFICFGSVAPPPHSTATSPFPVAEDSWAKQEADPSCTCVCSKTMERNQRDVHGLVPDIQHHLQHQYESDSSR